VVPGTAEIATKSEVQLGFAQLEGKIDASTLRLEAMIERSSKETMRWMLTFFVPLWLGTWGTVLALVLKH